MTRESLYEQVWAEPISKIAARFNLSDRGLAKLCARFDIPVPPRGWWAKKQHGHNVKPIPLPATGRVKPITIHKWWAPPLTPKPEEVPEEIVFEREPANRIVVPERTSKFHPFVAKTNDMMKGAKPQHYGRRVLFPSVGCLSVQVSKEQLPRALRIMDTLVRALEERRYAPSIPASDSGLSVRVLGSIFTVSLDEKTKQVKHQVADSERRGVSAGASTERYDLIPTGVLCLRCHDVYRMTYQVTDTTSRALEDRLNEFIVKLLEEAFAEQRRHEEREREQLARQEAERIRREEAARAAK